MKSRKSPLRQLINPRRIAIPVLFGLAVVAWLVYQNLNDTRFEATSGCGAYTWVDGNGNGIVDRSDQEDFQKTACGEYKRLTYIDILSRIDWSAYTFMWIVLSMIMMAIRDVSYMYRIRILTDGALSWTQSFQVIMLWEFASSVTPSVVGGAPIAIYLLSKEKIPVGKSTAIVLLSSLMDELFFVITVPVIFFFIGKDDLLPGQALQAYNMSHGIQLLFWVSYLLILLYSLFISFGLFISPALFKRLLIALFRLPVLRRWQSGAKNAAEDVMQTAFELRGKKKSWWVKSFAATITSWTARYLVINCLIMAFVFTSDHLVIYARQLVMWVLMLISPTPGSSGVAEFAFAVFLKNYVPPHFEGGMALLWRLISYYSYLVIGVMLLPKWLIRVYAGRRLVTFGSSKR